MGQFSNSKERNGKPEQVSNLLEGILKQLGIEEKFSASRVLDQWLDIVGSQVAANTKPHKVEKDVLFVYVSNSSWLMELTRFYKKTILKNIQEKTGTNTIKDIVFKLGPVR
ncbi:MAG: DUF721 domain-containing protein [Candidatus Auribacterota bacterium]